MVIPPPPPSGRSVGMKAWDAFLDFVDARSNDGWMFRGVGDRTFGLRPKVGRGDLVDLMGFVDELQERQVFESFKRNAPLYLSRPCTTDWEWLALAQHHGLPTRLLDWTSNPLIAAFFAVTNIKNNDAAIYAVKIERSMILTETEREGGPFKVQRVGFVSPSVASPRIASQKGFFTIHHCPDKDWQAPDIEGNTFIIPSEGAFYFRDKLFSLGVDHTHIMPDLDGLCRTLAWQYERGFVHSFLDY